MEPVDLVGRAEPGVLPCPLAQELGQPTFEMLHTSGEACDPMSGRVVFLYNLICRRAYTDICRSLTHPAATTDPGLTATLRLDGTQTNRAGG